MAEPVYKTRNKKKIVSEHVYKIKDSKNRAAEHVYYEIGGKTGWQNLYTR